MMHNHKSNSLTGLQQKINIIWLSEADAAADINKQKIGGNTTLVQGRAHLCFDKFFKL
jgi:hypothetical protein